MKLPVESARGAEHSSSFNQDTSGDFNMATGTQTHGARDQGSARRGSEGVYDQASEAISNMAEGASDMWDEAYDRGARYYREADGSVVVTAIVAGAIGYALAYLVHGYQSSVGRDWSGASRNHGREQNRRNYR